MKFLKVIIWLVILALSFSVVGAQEEVEAEEEWSGSYVISAASGTFERNDEGYVLVLNNVPKRISWVITVPQILAGSMTMMDFMGYWTFQPELTAKAILTTENESVVITLGLINDTPYNLDTDALTFSAIVEEIIPVDSEIEASKAELPEVFEMSTIFVTIDAEFLAGIARGAELRSQGTRFAGTAGSCTPIPPKTKCP